MPNLEHLKSFQSVVELESFSEAAIKAGLSQPAISLQIKQLEKEFGVTLIERVGRKPRPTLAGTELLPYIKQIMSTVDAMFVDMERHSSGGPCRIRLGTGATASIYFLPPILGSLRSAFPETEFVISIGNSPEIARAVEEGSLDLGLVTLPVSGRTLETISVFRDEFVAVSPNDGPSFAPPITPDALHQTPIILFEPAGNSRTLIDRWLSHSSMPVKPVMSLGSIEAIKELVAAGLGSSIIPRMAIRTCENKLVVSSLSPPLHRELAVIVRSDRPLRRGLKELIRALRKAKDERD